MFFNSQANFGWYLKKKNWWESILHIDIITDSAIVNQVDAAVYTGLTRNNALLDDVEKSHEHHVPCYSSFCTLNFNRTSLSIWASSTWGTPCPFRHIGPRSKTGRNSSHFLPLFRCIYVWEGFVWLISISSRKWSLREVVLIRKRGALSSQLQRQWRTATFPASSTPSE